MVTKTKKKASHGKVTIDGDMTIYTAAACKRKLLDALHRKTALDLDLSKIGEIDTAGVQVLLLLQREAQRLSKRLRLNSAPTSVRAVLDIYNLTAHFAVAQEAAGAKRVYLKR